MEPEDAAFTQQGVSKNYVKFYPKWVRNNFKSKEEGAEVGEYRDYIIIVSPGQPNSQVDRPVQEKDKNEYRSEWLAFQDGREQRISGTPIELLPGLPKERADSLKSLYIYTIEQVSELSEAAMFKVGMGAAELKNKAQAYLQKSSTEVNALKVENAKLQETIRQLSDRMAALEKPKRRGRPPSVQRVNQ
jgi:hypothetical protein